VKYLVTLTSSKGVSPAQLEQTAVASAQALWDLYLKDIVREMYVREDNAGVVFVAEGPSAEALAQALSTIPWVRDNLVVGEGIRLMPFRDLAAAFPMPAVKAA
jgi:hypothetical protein